LFYDLRYSYKQISLIDTDEGEDADQEFVHTVYPDEPNIDIVRGTQRMNALPGGANLILRLLDISMPRARRI
jgi:hypothetical protein